MHHAGGKMSHDTHNANVGASVTRILPVHAAHSIASSLKADSSIYSMPFNDLSFEESQVIRSELQDCY